jgi:alkaline phosphatase
VRTLLEDARDLRKATGLVTTSQVTDATPAAFGSHVADRGDQTEIARQYIEETMPDVVLGGGEDWWYPEGDPGAYPDDPADPRPEVSRSTIGNLVERAEDAGYDYVSTPEELEDSDADRLLGLFANEEMFEQFPEGQGDEYAPVVSLRDMTAKALDVLSEDRHGFFLMVEEEAIDEMAHSNNAARTIQAGQSLDETVALVREFAQRNRGTLVVVVGDHETGGMAIENVDEDDESGDPDNPSDDVTQSLEDGPFPIAGSDLQFTVDWTTGGHTGAATPLTAEGPGAERLARAQHATDVHDVILDAMDRRR